MYPLCLVDCSTAKLNRGEVCDARHGAVHIGAAGVHASVRGVPTAGPDMANPLLLPLLNWARRLRHLTLFKLSAALFALTLVLPDPVPFIDELLLGLGTVLLANWKHRRPAGADDRPPPIDGDARRR